MIKDNKQEHYAIFLEVLKEPQLMEAIIEDYFHTHSKLEFEYFIKDIVRFHGAFRDDKERIVNFCHKLRNRNFVDLNTPYVEKLNFVLAVIANLGGKKVSIDSICEAFDPAFSKDSCLDILTVLQKDGYVASDKMPFHNELLMGYRITETGKEFLRTGGYLAQKSQPTPSINATTQTIHNYGTINGVNQGDNAKSKIIANKGKEESNYLIVLKWIAGIATTLLTAYLIFRLGWN